MIFKKGDSVMTMSGTDVGRHGVITVVPPDHHLVLTSDGSLVIVYKIHLHPYTDAERKEFPPDLLDAMRVKALEEQS